MKKIHQSIRLILDMLDCEACEMCGQETLYSGKCSRCGGRMTLHSITYDGSLLIIKILRQSKEGNFEPATAPGQVENICITYMFTITEDKIVFLGIDTYEGEGHNALYKITIEEVWEEIIFDSLQTWCKNNEMEFEVPHMMEERYRWED